MILKIKQPSKKMTYYQSACERFCLNAMQQDDYFSCHSGDIGEEAFFRMIKDFEEPVIIWDVEFTEKFQGTAQFDFIVIDKERVIHYDIKNFRGNYSIQNDAFVNEYGRNVKNPDIQLHRAHNILESVVGSYSSTHHLKSYLVFINETFHLNSTGKPHWLFRSQLPKHLKQFEQPNFSFDEDLNLGCYLLSRHVASDHRDIPIRTDFCMSMKGLKCPYCLKMLNVELGSGQKKVDCRCGERKIRVQELVAHNLKELYVLKGESFSGNEGMEWCISSSRRTLNRVLLKNFKKKGKNKAITYYL